MKKILCLVFVSVGLVSVQQLPAQGTFVSNLGGTSVGSVAIGSDSWRGQPFTTGTNVGGYSVNSVQMQMADSTGNPAGFTVSIYNSINNHPGDSLGFLAGSDPTVSGIFSYTSTGIMLLPFKQYFVVATSLTPVVLGAYSWSIVAPSSTGNSTGGWSLVQLYYSSANGSAWNFDRGFTFQFAINATAVPEPSSLVLFSCGGLCLALRLFRHARAIK